MKKEERSYDPNQSELPIQPGYKVDVTEESSVFEMQWYQYDIVCSYALNNTGITGICTLENKPPTLHVLNKKDLIKPGEIAKRIEWYEKNADVDDVIPVSAKYGHGIDGVRDWILSKLPFGPAYYPKDIISEHPERFFIGEIVREKIFMQYMKEVPYACQVFDHIFSLQLEEEVNEVLFTAWLDQLGGAERTNRLREREKTVGSVLKKFCAQ
ncbi:GTPase Era [Carex littledalei]|uniref:GTPase Era n=1 Tax=Carex littledalei TaxID=544730 RepID=A0A833RIV5_9POAL|nr:GTPase Era [Carex littledalei]